MASPKPTGHIVADPSTQSLILVPHLLPLHEFEKQHGNG